MLPARSAAEIGTFLSLSKSATLTMLDVSEWALLIFGAILVAGLIIEYHAEHASRWMKLGEMLVIVGVAGELLGDGGIFLFSRHLQMIADQEIADLTITAGNAKASAETAAKAADRANISANDAGVAAGQAQDKLAQIVAALEPRSLTKKDIAEIAEAARPCVKSNIRVVIKTLRKSPRLAYQILKALKDAGFNIDIDPTSLAGTPEVSFSGPPEQLPPGGAMPCIIDALVKPKKVHIWGVTKVLPPGSPVTIWVGDREPGVLPK